MTDDIRICFIGDSLINGTGDEEKLGWAGRLCANLHSQGIPVTYYNLGIRRDTSRDILQRLEAESTLRLPKFCDARIVISCGVNDTVIENSSLRVTPEESLENIRDILRSAKKYKAILIGPPPVDDDEQNERIKLLSKAFACEASAQGVPYIDIFSTLVSDISYRQEISNNDGSHPRGDGYTKIADIISSSPNWWFHPQ